MPLTVSRPRSSTAPPPKRVAHDQVPDTPPPMEGECQRQRERRQQGSQGKA
jgi:hypothetical protein